MFWGTWETKEKNFFICGSDRILGRGDTGQQGHFLLFSFLHILVFEPTEYIIHLINKIPAKMPWPFNIQYLRDSGSLKNVLLYKNI